ncbi:alpha/beta fold hydrolase, partial [Mycobacteroides abscessus]
MLEAILSKPSNRRAPIEMGEGEPVLLLHPFMLSQSVWETVAEQLADAGYEVFAPTYPGHNGGGPMPKLPPFSQRSVDVYLDQIEQIMDQKGWETAHLVGNSLGGWIALG